MKGFLGLWLMFCGGPVVLMVLMCTVIYMLARGGGRLLSMKDREIQRRYNQNRCLNCGYDLRVNTHGRCPECGKF